MNVLANDLSRRYEQVTPQEFYRDIFGDGNLDSLDAMTPGKYTGIAVRVETKGRKDAKVSRYTVTDDLDVIDDLTNCDDFCVIAPISYAGKSRKSKYGRDLYAIAIDIDHLRTKRQGTGKPMLQSGLAALEQQWLQPSGWGGRDAAKRPYIPQPTYVVASGTGLHLYYVLTAPVPLYRDTAHALSQWKHNMTRLLWNTKVTRDHTENKIQYESLFQGFRMVGSITKKGDRVEAFRTGEPVTLDYLGQWGGSLLAAAERSKLPLSVAKVKYPDWYDRRIVQGLPANRWVANRAVYDWWLRRISDPDGGVVVGHRYYCIMMLAVYAQKCNIPQAELERDALALRGMYAGMTDDPNNRFTVRDIMTALQVYDDDEIYKMRIDKIEERSGLHIDRNRRNGRPQAEHLVRARAVRDAVHPDGWNNQDGRPDKKDQVAAWQKDHPGGTKSQCKADTGLTYPTIRKWWSDGCKSNKSK